MDWISVEDSLPEGVNDVLFVTQGTVVMGYYYEPGEEWTNYETKEWDGDYETLTDVTHWAPLPDPPE